MNADQIDLSDSITDTLMLEVRTNTESSIDEQTLLACEFKFETCSDTSSLCTQGTDADSIASSFIIGGEELASIGIAKRRLQKRQVATKKSSSSISDSGSVRTAASPARKRAAPLVGKTRSVKSPPDGSNRAPFTATTAAGHQQSPSRAGWKDVAGSSSTMRSVPSSSPRSSGGVAPEAASPSRHRPAEPDAATTVYTIESPAHVECAAASAGCHQSSERLEGTESSSARRRLRASPDELQAQAVAAIDEAMYGVVRTSAERCEMEEVGPQRERPLTHYEKQMVSRHHNPATHYINRIRKYKRALLADTTLMPMTTLTSCAPVYDSSMLDEFSRLSRVVRYSLEELNWRRASALVHQHDRYCARFLSPKHRAPTGVTAQTQPAARPPSRHFSASEGKSAPDNPLANRESSFTSFCLANDTDSTYSSCSAGSDKVPGWRMKSTSAGGRAASTRQALRSVEVRTPAMGPVTFELIYFSPSEVAEEVKRIVLWCAARGLRQVRLHVGGSNNLSGDVCVGEDAATSSEVGNSSSDAHADMPEVKTGEAASSTNSGGGGGGAVYFAAVCLLLESDRWLKRRVQVLLHDCVTGIVDLCIAPRCAAEAMEYFLPGPVTPTKTAAVPKGDAAKFTAPRLAAADGDGWNVRVPALPKRIRNGEPVARVPSSEALSFFSETPPQRNANK